MAWSTAATASFMIVSQNNLREEAAGHLRTRATLSQSPHSHKLEIMQESHPSSEASAAHCKASRMTLGGLHTLHGVRESAVSCGVWSSDGQDGEAARPHGRGVVQTLSHRPPGHDGHGNDAAPKITGLHDHNNVPMGRRIAQRALYTSMWSCVLRTGNSLWQAQHEIQA
ncbi:hypothetical protein FA95DRAFT_638707 [Auriscalpium vulgare]|uniref:Uncharacterized protein n=1 Tax=Auriscalpium vulgare TaxID=40419 RepID=A0ACB8RD44_9AGAM|nr:hypothetical protein FA95DRAFT_638707 [Auriscalpium vulgare]